MAVEIKQDQAYAYAELLEILSYTDITLVNKIPNKLMNIFKSYALPNYEKHINATNEKKQQLSKQFYQKYIPHTQAIKTIGEIK